MNHNDLYVLAKAAKWATYGQEHADIYPEAGTGAAFQRLRDKGLLVKDPSGRGHVITEKGSEMIARLVALLSA